MVRSSRVEETCQYCQTSLEFFSNTNLYLHYLRHYQDKRREAGYHLLDRSRLAERDQTVEDMEDLQEILEEYKGPSAWY